MGKFRSFKKSGTKPLIKEESEPSSLGGSKTQKMRSYKSKKSSKVISPTPTLESLEETCVKELSSSKLTKITPKELRQAKAHLTEILLQLRQKKQRLYQVANRKLAKEIVEVLNKHLAPNLRATVVRDTEVNIYDFLVYDFEEYEKQIARSNRNFVREFAKKQVPDFQKRINKSRAYDAYKRRKAKKRQDFKKDDIF